MTVIGIDAHKDWHTLVAVDEVGRRIKELTVEARAAGHRRIMTWLEGFEDVTVAVGLPTPDSSTRGGSARSRPSSRARAHRVDGRHEA